jgi:hypothetical protein
MDRRIILGTTKQAVTVMSTEEGASARKDAKTFLATISLENLIEGFPAWWRVLQNLLRHPFLFAKNLSLDEPQALRLALRYALYSILVMFLLTAPVFLAHHTKVNKFIFLVRMCSQFALVGILLHYGLRLLGAKRSLSATMTSYLYIGSTGTQLYLLLALPLLIRLGPDAIFGGWQESMQLGSAPSTTLDVVLLGILADAFGIFMFYVFLKWFGVTHQLRKRRVLVAAFISGIFTLGIQLFLLAPLFQWLERSVGGFLELF